MTKSPDAFRTISEVSEWLDTPAHVLRFWESKFPQIKPIKRAGGRRYYRPEDMALLGGIKTLLHDQGMTIKGVLKLLREKGIRHVAGLGPQPDLAGGAVITADLANGGDTFDLNDADSAAPSLDPAAPVPLLPTPVTGPNLIHLILHVDPRRVRGQSRRILPLYQRLTSLAGRMARD
jgi:resuscitation-promoting factor RpfA